MPVYMLDTDIASYIMNGSNASVLSSLQRVAVRDVCISAITKSELMCGVQASPRKAKDQTRLETFLRYIQVLDYPGDAALDYGQIRADLKIRGTKIGANDLHIAAHACNLGLTLVTNNAREFGARSGTQNRELGLEIRPSPPGLYHVSARSALTPAPSSAVSSSLGSTSSEKLCSGLILTMLSRCARSSGTSRNPTLCPVK
jgi:tRNA(fMet)-specific endonuclease VapC